MKIKLIDRYNFTKFIDSHEVFDGEGIEPELVYSTPFGEVRFELTGETRAGVPYYRQARRQEEHQPAYNAPTPRFLDVDPQEFSNFNMDHAGRIAVTVGGGAGGDGSSGGAGGPSVVGSDWTMTMTEALSQPMTASSLARAVEDLGGPIVARSDSRFDYSSGVSSILREHPHWNTAMSLFMQDGSIPERLRRDMASGNISRTSFERHLRDYAHRRNIIF